MDELVKSCLHEIAFDGDYGCDASRLKSFIEKFYSGNSSTQQNVDDGFRALVWSYIVQHPSVRVGFRPANVTQDVFIADDVDRARGKGLARQKYVNNGNNLADEQGAALPGLNCLDQEQIENSTLDELLERHGKELRIAVAPQLCFQAITGSTLTPARLTPLTYTVLQLVARAREKGITFVELARITGYGAGSVFYLIKTLETAGLVKKLATIAHTGTQMAVHTHFYLHHPDWQAIRLEDSRQASAMAPKPDPSRREAIPPDSELAPEDDHDLEESPGVHFDPIDSRHLGRPDIIISRVIKLLENSKNNSHKQINMLIRIGMVHPGKGQRRRFSNIMDAAVSQGILERLYFPSGPKRNNHQSLARVLRLVDKDKLPAQFTMTESGDAEANADADEKEVEAEGKAALAGTRYLATLTLQRNLIEVVHASGIEGINLSGVHRELGLCEVRTYEHQLQKMSKKTQVLPHISDMNIVLLSENIGRERRLRVYTTRNFALLLQREGLEDPEDEHAREDPYYSEGFSVHSPADFFRDDAELKHFVDNYQPRRAKTETKTHRRAWRLGFGKPKIFKNPIGPDGKPKKGRPRKYPEGETRQSMEKKRKLEEAFAEGSERPTKKARKSRKDYAAAAASSDLGREPKKPGRKPKHRPDSETPAPVQNELMSEAAPPVPVMDDHGHEGVKVSEFIPLPRGGLVGGVLAGVKRHYAKRSRTPGEDISEPALKRAVHSWGISMEEINGGQNQLLAPENQHRDASSHYPIHVGELRHAVSDSSAVDDASNTVQSNRSSTRATRNPYRVRRREFASLPRKTDISYARRAQDVLEVLKRHEGVLHAGLPLMNAHRDYLQELEASGSRPPGTATLMDKRTLRVVVDLLVHDKEVKVLTTDGGAYGQRNRALYLLYLPDTPVEVLDQYRHSLEKEFRFFNIRPPNPTATAGALMEYSEVDRRKKRKKSRVRSLRHNLTDAQERTPRRAQLVDASESAKSLAAKARQTKHVLDESWAALVAQTIETLVPGTFDVNAPELLAVKKAWYLRGGSMNVDNARDRIISAITGTAMPAIKKMERRYTQPNRQGQQRDVPHCSLCDKHMEIIKGLVAQQEAQHRILLEQQQEKAIGKRQRNSRYTWTPEYDELALDAEAVIRARCGPEQIAAVSLYSQIFPRLTASSIRTHLAKLRELRQGGNAYCSQLQTAWNALRLQPHADVPDPFPESLTHFPLERHIAYLRAHLDKSKLGVPRVDDPLQPEDELLFVLPDDISYISTQWDVVSTRDPVTEWDFMWALSTDELRERNMHYEAFTMPSVLWQPAVTAAELSSVRRAEAAVKMTVAPSEEDYDGARATEMLNLLGQQRVGAAFNDLKHSGVIKAIGDRKPASGRAMAISEHHLDALDGQIGWKLFRDADLLERDLMHLELEPWSLMSSDGRTAGLLELISDDKVELAIDVSTCTALDFDVGISSRKINDENLENNIYVSAKDETPALAALAKSSVPFEEPIIAHSAVQHAGEEVRCFNAMDGPTNCPECINKAFDGYLQGLTESDMEQVRQLRNSVIGAGAMGLSVAELQRLVSETAMPFPFLRSKIWDLVSGPVPILACIGYDEGRITSATFLKEWCLQTSRQPFDMVAPRRWLQPTGRRDEAMWQMSLRHVMGRIITRPGISELALRERSISLFDRLEMNDLLQFLSNEGFATRMAEIDEATPILVGFSTKEEEADWHWHVGHVPWYRIH
ncbi:hypothetical protein CALVIDRAFT_597245 [Calocera viscosa TUFC12733]|uniref:Uncharacterized protein n=1 Tax=Calocera viscosa (strain TUFC12733) TaxID=1330018 RepID=A0A167NIX8_CALVF|nr:hypothetical protein CALVIDRAFT_597245 [Calocera viscosa TUFC12733]